MNDELKKILLKTGVDASRKVLMSAFSEDISKEVSKEEEKSYDNAVAFVTKLAKDNAQYALENIPTEGSPEQVAAQIALQTTVMLGKTVMETAKFCERQDSKRAKINAERDAYIAQINAQKELLLTYLDKSFDERKVNFENFFNRLDKAMAQNDVEQMSIILSSINQLAAISPFKVLQARKNARRALEDPNFELDV